MKEVYMTLVIRVAGSLTLNAKDVTDYEIGGFEFVIDEQEVPFDFSGHSMNFLNDKNGQYIQIETGDNDFFKNYDIDPEPYLETYTELGIDPIAITAPYLASATAISYFNFYIELSGGRDLSEDLILESVCFTDEHGGDHYVGSSILGKTLAVIQGE